MRYCFSKVYNANCFRVLFMFCCGSVCFPGLLQEAGWATVWCRVCLHQNIVANSLVWFNKCTQNSRVNVWAKDLAGHSLFLVCTDNCQSAVRHEYFHFLCELLAVEREYALLLDYLPALGSLQWCMPNFKSADWHCTSSLFLTVGRRAGGEVPLQIYHEQEG